jgi:hypothetical protein
MKVVLHLILQEEPDALDTIKKAVENAVIPL